MAKSNLLEWWFIMAKKKTVLKIQYDSPVVLTFALLCLGALLANYLTDGWTNQNLFCVYRASFYDPLTYVRFFGHVLGHADMVHFFSNICLLLVLGPVCESRYGSTNVLFAIIITALVTGLVQFIFFPGTGLLGASGIVFMMIFMSSISGIKKGNIPVTLIFVALIYIGQEVSAMLLQDDSTSQLTHIIGGVCGIFLGAMMARKKR